MDIRSLQFDVTVASLPPVERMFLWAIRAWSAHHSDLSPVWWSLDRAFSQERIGEALPPFHRLMSSVFAGLTRWPDIRCVACQWVGAEEAQLLELFASVQQGDSLATRRSLQGWVLRSAARLVREAAVECVAIVTRHDVRFSLAAAQSETDKRAESSVNLSIPRIGFDSDPLLHP